MIQGLYPFTERWHKSGTVWLYSDPHFDDTYMEQSIPGRPSTREQINSINSKVSKNDTLVLLGDIGNVERVRALRGYKVLICGNHDHGHTTYRREVRHIDFDSKVYPKREAYNLAASEYPGWKISIDSGYSFHSPFTFWRVTVDNQLFDEVYSGPLMISDKIILSHEPLDTPWAFNIHGHIHSRAYIDDRQHWNVCADVVNYRPISLNVIVKSGALKNVQSIHRMTIEGVKEHE